MNWMSIGLLALGVAVWLFLRARRRKMAIAIEYESDQPVDVQAEHKPTSPVGFHSPSERAA
ncbi:PEP-CTERM protein-sorting domain-containing protein [Sphingomonas sp. NFR04]|jgi:hypothetical protein|uniref:hypothetical protein n=1 Tax=Sphingomonas sp. NFR04 TaxID=1566283 RepID=UPI0008E6E071|nr:hypothetical protein [Sphingomonas sp. NFR04]SFJ50317.1 PEP-CTERM protein-sorting domain-containing protein [Sphingomonas sp. NFR04]